MLYQRTGSRQRLAASPRRPRVTRSRFGGSALNQLPWRYSARTERRPHGTNPSDTGPDWPASSDPMTMLAHDDAKPLDTLLPLLTPEALDRDLFLGDPGPGEGRLFGGMVAAQTLMAASLTVPEERCLHSLHSYFLRGGVHDAPIRFVVDRIRDGRSFTTRRVTAHQQGEAIFNMSASFKTEEAGAEHQSPMPDAPAPENTEAFVGMRQLLIPDDPQPAMEPVMELRMCDPFDRSPSPDDMSQRIWMRVRGELPDDPRIHTAVLVYASDRCLMSTAMRPHAHRWEGAMTASLDHSVWIHRPFRFDDWVLYVCESPVGFASRGLCLGSLYTRNGHRIASATQEALIRLQ